MQRRPALLSFSLAIALSLSLATASCAPRGPTLATSGAGARAKQSGAARAQRTCHAATDCVVVPRTCCGRCGAAVPGDAVAVSARWLEHAGAERSCEGGSGCPDCHQSTAPTLVATCRSHQCALVDLTRSPITACRSDADCTLTYAGCCACGSPGAIAVRRGREDAYRRRICGTGPVACPQCIGRPLVGTPECVAGHCAIADDGRADL